ncbi:MAG: proton-conducting transporter membrane subunit [Labedaea sp.]
MTTLVITSLMVGPMALPGIGALLYALVGWRPRTAWLAAVCAAGILVCGIGLGIVVSAAGAHLAANGLLRVDALSAFMIIVIGAVGLLATAASPAFLRAEIHSGRSSARTAARQSLLVQGFLAAMSLAVLAANLGVVWVAIEATTIVTAFLVGQGRSRAAVEAAWKYVVICSVGIALAFLGMILLNYASAQTPSPAELDWVTLVAGAHNLDPGVTRIAVALLVVGFGTKVGLTPLHAWLPDAHSQAPAPVSALMSGVLLSVAFYAILRIKAIADPALGPGFVRALLLVTALATLAIAASLLLAQRDYKRMLAYSSMEHMGLLALGAAAGGRLAIAAVLLHVLGHGLAKAVLFLSSGRILQLTGSPLITGVRGLAAQEPVLAGLVGVGVLALLGFPPFSLFASELGIFTGGYTSGTGLATSAALILVLVITAALLGHTGHMLLGDPPPPAARAQGPGAATAPEATAGSTVATLGCGLAVCAVLGVTAGPLSHLLSLAADILTGTP